MNKPFKFKQFIIHQDKCAMKVGTDGVLLGAWTSLKNNPDSILDIGAGTGLIALQLAQRSNATLIDALEIDNDAYIQAVENFENSHWADRLFCYHTSLEEFTNEIEEKYDLIVSNPPFYKDEYHSNNKARNTARSTSSLSFEKLVYSASKLLSKTGILSVITPHKEEENLIDLAHTNNLYPIRICRVKGNSSSPIKRSLLEFSFQKSEIKIDELIIEIERHQYTNAYIDLVEEFYLKM